MPWWLGYSMVYGIAKMLNSRGNIMIGASVASVPRSTGHVPLLARVLGDCTVLSVIERLAYKPLRRQNEFVLITAIGVSYLLQNLARVGVRPNPMSYFRPSSRPPSISLFDGQLILTGDMLVLTFFTSHHEDGQGDARPSPAARRN